jgi:alpha-ketoglutarate-dependent taurine dioxygenase
MLEFAALTPLGAQVTGRQVDALANRTVVELRRLLAEHGVIVLPGQDVGNDGFLRFLRSFGPMMFTAGETPVAGFPDLNLMSNVGRARPPRLVAETVKYLFDHSTRATNVFRHAWSSGDVVIWDNRCVMHRADHTGVVGDRVMHRGMVADHARVA